jgi:hypothetical protein
VKPIWISFLSGIQIFDPILMEFNFFLAIRCNQELAGQISSKSNIPRFSSEFQLIEISLNFSSNSISNLDKFLSENFVPYLKPFLDIFYFQFFEQGKAPFGSVRVWSKFESVWNKFDSVWGKFESVWNKFDSVWKPNRATLCCGARVSAPLRVVLAPHPVTARRAPRTPDPACLSRVSAPRASRRPPL